MVSESSLAIGSELENPQVPPYSIPALGPSLFNSLLFFRPFGPGCSQTGVARLRERFDIFCGSWDNEPLGWSAVSDRLSEALHQHGSTCLP